MMVMSVFYPLGVPITTYIPYQQVGTLESMIFPFFLRWEMWQVLGSGWLWCLGWKMLLWFLTNKKHELRIHFKRCTPKTFGAVFCEIWNHLFVYLAIQLAGNFQDQKSSRPNFFNQQQNDIFEVQDSLEGAGKEMDPHSIRCFFWPVEKTKFGASYVSLLEGR